MSDPLKIELIINPAEPPLANPPQESDKILMYHGTSLDRLDSIKSHGGILRPSLHLHGTNFNEDLIVKQADAIYLSKHASEALIYGTLNNGKVSRKSKIERKLIVSPQGQKIEHFRFKKYVPTKAAVIFEVEVPRSSLHLETTYSSRGVQVPKDVVATLRNFECDLNAIRPVRFTIVPASSDIFSSRDFKQGLEFWDYTTANAQNIFGLSYAEYIESDFRLIQRLYKRNCETF